MARGLALVGLLVSALLVAWLLLRSSSKPPASASSSGTPSGKLGEVPPDELTKDPVAMKKHIEAQNCSANCEGALQLCLGMADGEAGESRCREQRTTCEGSCAAP